MLIRSIFRTLPRHNGVQRATLCRSVTTTWTKPSKISVLQTTNYKSQVLYSRVSNQEIKNQDHKVAQEPIASEESHILTRAQKLKKAVAEYGTTVMVFHIGISLISLGTCYLFVSSGLDINQVLVNLGLSEWVAGKTILVSNAGTFAVAYAIHKVFAPVRISITLASVPFIVRYLRQRGILQK